MVDKSPVCNTAACYVTMPNLDTKPNLYMVHCFPGMARDSTSDIVRSETYHIYQCTKKSSLGYLDCKTLADKDNWLSLGSQEKFGIAICFIFKEMK